MTLKKYLFTVSVIAFLVISFSYLRSVFADWRTDLDPPTTTISATGSGCSSVNTGPDEITTTCPNTTSVNVVINCSDSISGCQSIYSKKIDSTPPDDSSFINNIPPGTYTYNFTPSFSPITSAGGTPVTIEAYSIDQAGNSGAAAQKTNIINFVYQVSGTVFLDNFPSGNPDGINRADPDDPKHNQGIRIKAVNTSTGAEKECLPSVCTSGIYSLTLAAGTYRISFEEFPSGYNQTEPPAGAPPPSFTVIVGPGCDVTNPSPPPLPWSKNASCTASNNIEKLDFGMKQNADSPPWFQCIGADCRIDTPPNGFRDILPLINNNCSSPSYPNDVASIPNGTTSNMPGVIFSGGAIDLGTGQASENPYNWRVEGTKFVPVRPKVIRTSYNYYIATVTQNGLQKKPLKDVAGCSDGATIICTSLPNDLANGIYFSGTGKSVEFDFSATETLTGSKDYVFLIDGDLTITNKGLLVDSGSTGIFSVSRDIIVGPNVGGNAQIPCNVANHNGCHLEGYFSADRNFVIDSAPSTLRLNVAGSIVVNANKEDDAVTVGKFSWNSSNNRTLGVDNSSCPVFTITERPDFILNAPEFIKHPSFTWQEVAP